VNRGAQAGLRYLVTQPRLLAGCGDLDFELAVPGQACDAHSCPDWRIGWTDITEDLVHFGEIVEVCEIDDAPYDVVEPEPDVGEELFHAGERGADFCFEIGRKEEPRPFVVNCAP
jgi:hypothetical protein